jgi:hypothetical protein
VWEGRSLLGTKGECLVVECSEIFTLGERNPPLDGSRTKRNCRKLTHNGIDMEMRRCRWLSKLSAMEESRSPRRMLGAWCSTPRAVGRPQQTIRHAYITTLEKLSFEEEKGQLRERMTVARDRSAWGQRAESQLDFTNLRRH